MRRFGAFLLLLFAVAACGGASSGTVAAPTVTASPTPTQTTASGPVVRIAQPPTSVCDGYRDFAADLEHYPHDQVLLVDDVDAIKKIALATSNHIPREEFIDAEAMASYVSSVDFQSQGSATAPPILTLKADCAKKA